MVKGSFVL